MKIVRKTFDNINKAEDNCHEDSKHIFMQVMSKINKFRKKKKKKGRGSTSLKSFVRKLLMVKIMNKSFVNNKREEDISDENY